MSFHLFLPAPPAPPDLHRVLDERRPLRRGGAERLQLISDAAPFSGAAGLWLSPIPDPHPALAEAPRATLYDLARDPRFLRRAVPAQSRPVSGGLRVRLARALLWLGWRLLSPGRA